MLLKPLRLAALALAFAISAPDAFAFTVPWGDAPEQLGLVNQPEQERIGPLTFSLGPQGTLYVADTVHRSVKEFSSDGAFLRVVANNVRPSCLAFDPSGNLLQLDGHSVDVLSSSGAHLRTLQIPETVPLIEGYAQEVFADGALIGVNDPDENVYLFGADGRQAKAQGLQSRTRGRIRTQMVTRESAELRLGSRGKSPETAVQVRPSAGRSLGAVIFRGEGPKGEMVAEVEEVAGNYVHLKAKRFAADGTFSEIELPNDYFTTVYRKFQQAPDGTLWQMQTTPSGVEFTQRSISR